MTAESIYPGAAIQMTVACTEFLNSLSPDQEAKATYPYLDGERIFWYFPPLNRHGLPLRDMDSKQRGLAFKVMASGLTDRSYEQAKSIIEHEDVLGPLEKEQGTITFVRDTELYYFTIFGEPGGQEPWGWRVEGHHVCLNYSIWGNKVISATPFFFGVNPAEVRKGPKLGLRILGAREDLAFELMESLDLGQRAKAIIYDEAPLDILTFNSSKVSLPREEGLPASAMSGTQKEMLMALMTEYVSQAHGDIAQERLDRFKTQGIDNIHLAWAGQVDKTKEHYYRLHGGDFVVEFDNRQNGANHIHSVWREIENDFAADVLREHMLLYHVL
ncbi:MAG: hypothetical protein BZY88_00360 [SAR202 cluster bacterium Io17-Chloro-G9]|nr:MAG: hypothetical protein BZY88_00360 [SAR202 cluster bacterium Io17-Chloro-G9]